MSHSSDNVYLSMAVQTVLARHRKKFHSFLNPAQETALIQEMADQIMTQAERFKQITESALKQSQP